MKKLLLSLLVIVIILFSGAAYIINSYLNEDNIRNIIVSTAKDKMNADISISKIDIGIFPDFTVSLKDISFNQQDKLKAKVSSVDIIMEDTFSTILSKNLRFSKLNISDISFAKGLQQINIKQLDSSFDIILSDLYNLLSQDNYVVKDINKHLSVLRTDGNISITELSANGYNIDYILADFSLKDKKLIVDAKDIRLYEGKAIINIDSDSVWLPSSPIKFKLNAKDIKTALLLNNSKAKKYLSVLGEAKIDGALENRNGNIVNAINASGVIGLKDGYVKGIDLGGMLVNNPASFANIGNVNLLKTPILNASANFDLKDSILNSDKINIDTGFVVVDGKGNANLAKQKLDFRIVPSLDVVDNHTIGNVPLIPFMIKGRFDKLLFIPDVKALVKDQIGGAVKDIIKNPSNAKNIIKNIGKDIKNTGKGLEGAAKSIIGNFKNRRTESIEGN